MRRAHRVVALVIIGALALGGACVLQSETVSGPQGPAGETGPPGATTVTIDGGTISIQDLANLVLMQQQTIGALQAQVEALKQQVDDPDCPPAYLRTADVDFIVCKSGPKGQEDEIVRVGRAPNPFWIDRYEAVIVDAITGMATDPTSLSTFPPSGQWTTPQVPVIAQSRKGLNPTSFATWFQVNEACRAAGKRLPTGDEWLAAARGTFDPGVSDGAAGRCNTNGVTVRVTGGAQTGDANACVSRWGAEDMIGNLGEVTAEWYPGVGDASQYAFPWPADFGDGNDVTANVASMPYSVGAQKVLGLPAVAMHGGIYKSGAGAGIFAFDVSIAPTLGEWKWGFRCVIGR